MENVITLEPNDSVRLDPDRLAGLYARLDSTEAEDIICRAAEELALRLSNCEQLWRRRDWAALRKGARSLVAISDQVGMTLLARVAHDVTRAVDAQDPVSTSATLYRLIRVGEGSLSAIWDQRDLSI